MSRFLSEALSHFSFTRDLRRDFHRHPELGYEEIRTAGIVAAELVNLGLEVTTGVAQTGVVAVLEGGRPGPVVMLRFDMDALRVQEETSTAYASEIDGKMHACGHDGHVAVGLTVARILTAHRAEFGGTVKFIFQPAEEGLGGAETMIAAGVLENPRPDTCLAIHLWNEREVGWVGLPAGPIMACMSTFKVKLMGKGGHGALPHQVVDPMVAAAQVVMALQTIVSRNISPFESAVVSVTRIAGGETYNVIPPAVELQGTIRTFDENVRQVVFARLESIVQNTAAAFGCNAEVKLHVVTPAMVNDESISLRLQDIFRDRFPDLRLDTAVKSTVSEDMAFFMREIPGCYFLVGSADPRSGRDYAHHHPKFDFDENVLPLAAAALCEAAFALLEPVSQVQPAAGITQADLWQDDNGLESAPDLRPTVPVTQVISKAKPDFIPQRVVSLVPSMTESLCELGLGHTLVGVTDYCTSPAEALKDLPRIGGPKDARIEDILALKPDFVLANQEENTPQIVAGLAAAGIFTWLTFSRTVDESVADLWDLAEIFRYEPAVLGLKTLQMALDWLRSSEVDRPRFRYFCPIWQGTDEDGTPWWMTFNDATYPGDLLKLLGGDNIFAERRRRYPLEADLGRGQEEPAGLRDTRYPRVLAADIISGQPDIILLPDEPDQFDEERVQNLRTLLEATKAVRQDRLVRLDGSLLFWNGIRLAKAISELPTALF